MISVIVQRSPGDRTGPDITDSLLTATHAAVERGRVEIDASTPVLTETLTGPLRRWWQPGAMVAFRGRRSTWHGQLNRCNLTVTREGESFTADFSLEVERPA